MYSLFYTLIVVLICQHRMCAYKTIMKIRFMEKNGLPLVVSYRSEQRVF